MQKHIVIIIPGLGDNVKGLQFITDFWTRYGLIPVIFSMEWNRPGNNFQLKFYELILLIDKYKKLGKVSLVGTSAGASVVLNAYTSCKKDIYKVVNICGRLRAGQSTGFRSFKNMTRGHPGFAESVKTSEINEKSLGLNDRKKFMTVRPLFGDQLVPSDTVVINGAKNIVIPTTEHVISIIAALTIFSDRVISFLNS